MSFTLFILIGVLFTFLCILFRNPIISVVGSHNPFVKKLQETRWMENHWLSGIFVFIMNAFLFFTTGLILYGVIPLAIPFIHFLVMVLAVVLSLYFWVIINQSWQGKKENRLKMGTVGSSFYLMLAVYVGYKLATLEPLFPGDDTFMRAIGLIFVIIVAIVAFATCFIITGIGKNTAEHVR